MEQKDKDSELCVSEAWAFEQGMLMDAKIPNGKKVAYLVARWEQMVYMSVSEAKEWIARFGDTGSEDDQYARLLLERYISISTEHANRLTTVRQECLARMKGRRNNL